MINVRAPADQIAPAMRRLAFAVSALMAVVVVLSVMAENGPIIIFGGLGPNGYIPLGGAAVYLGWAVFFILSIRESRWSAIAIGVLGFAVFCFGQAVLAGRFLIAGSGYSAQLPSLIGHLVMGFLARRQWKIHGKAHWMMHPAREASVPSGFNLLAKGIGSALVAATIYSIWMVCFHPFRLQFWSNPAPLLTGAVIALHLRRCRLRRSWRLPLTAGFAVALFNLHRTLRLDLSLSLSSRTWAFVGLVLLWTVGVALILARLHRDDAQFADDVQPREAD